TKAGLKRFILNGSFRSGPAAITFAARNPERVSKLVLWCTYAAATEFTSGPRGKTIIALRDQDWETYCQAVAHITEGWSAGQEAREAAALFQESMSQDDLVSV